MAQPHYGGDASASIGVLASQGTRQKPGSLTTLEGGTSTGWRYNTTDVSRRHFGDGLFEDGRVTGLAWEMPWSGSYLDDDPAITDIIEAARAGDELYVEYQPVSGGRVFSGFATVMSLEITSPADGLIDVSWTFKGRGEDNEPDTPEE